MHVKKLIALILVLAFLCCGCDFLLEEDDGRPVSSMEESEQKPTAEDALPHIIAAADVHIPAEENVTRLYEYRKRTVKSNDTVCYIYNIIDDYGDYRRVAARYAASADGSVVLYYNIDTDEYLPLT